MSSDFPGPLPKTTAKRKREWLELDAQVLKAAREQLRFTQGLPLWYRPKTDGKATPRKRGKGGRPTKHQEVFRRWLVLRRQNCPIKEIYRKCAVEGLIDMSRDTFKRTMLRMEAREKR
jgi:hypothetical protein